MITKPWQKVWAVNDVRDALDEFRPAITKPALSQRETIRKNWKVWGDWNTDKPSSESLSEKAILDKTRWALKLDFLKKYNHWGSSLENTCSRRGDLLRTNKWQIVYIVPQGWCCNLFFKENAMLNNFLFHTSVTRIKWLKFSNLSVYILVLINSVFEFSIL